MVGLDCHLILRSEIPDEDPSYVGNLLFSRSCGATIHQCSVAEYGSHGSAKLLDSLEATLTAEGKKPYVIPVGGSNSVGTWGYIEGCAELKRQIDAGEVEPVDKIVLACGSGGTAAGIAQGLKLAFGEETMPRLYPVCVCDNEAYFYNEMASILTEMGYYASRDSARAFLEEKVSIINGRGAGYGISRAEEIEFISDFARTSGVLLDTCYTGKALFKFCAEVAKGRVEGGGNLMFWHTGGGLGTFKEGLTLEEKFVPAKRMVI